jgi:hypothetical protein
MLNEEASLSDISTCWQPLSKQIKQIALESELWGELSAIADKINRWVTDNNLYIVVSPLWKYSERPSIIRDQHRFDILMKISSIVRPAQLHSLSNIGKNTHPHVFKASRYNRKPLLLPK